MILKEGTPWTLAVVAIYPVEVAVWAGLWCARKELRLPYHCSKIVKTTKRRGYNGRAI
jgi:hypothetical protein